MRDTHYRRSPSPLTIFAFMILVFWLFGFKLFFFLPFLFIFGASQLFGQCGMNHDEQDWTSEKPKRKAKPKYEDDWDDDADDIRYV